MSAQKIRNTAKNTQRNTRTARASHDTAAPAADTVEVLYQRMGDRWYAFSLIGEELFYGAIEAGASDGASLSDATVDRTGRGKIAA